MEKIEILGILTTTRGLLRCTAATSTTAFAHLAPTIGLGRVPDPKSAQKGPAERGAGVFVGFGVYGVKKHPLAIPHP
jgi:hypothetical protein